MPIVGELLRLPAASTIQSPFNPLNGGSLQAGACREPGIRDVVRDAFT
jgi:hypothetical protein